MWHILVIEDDTDIREMLVLALGQESFRVESAACGKSGLDKALTQIPDLILLDLMLPLMPGTEVCKALRADPRTQSCPILMLTAKGEESDIVLGLGLGADDYIVKPFSLRELVARIRARLRPLEGASKTLTKPSSSLLRHGKISIDPERYEVRIGDQIVFFTLAEFRLLRSLVERPGFVQTRDTLLEALTKGEAVVIDRNIDVHIRSIRKKLGSERELIETIRGVGYRFREHSAP